VVSGLVIGANHQPRNHSRLPTNEGLRLTEKKEGELSSEGERASYLGRGPRLLAAELANYRLPDPEIQLSGQGIWHRRLLPKPSRTARGEVRGRRGRGQQAGRGRS
jgi:hypothetical protein